jgi:hypothetical protein
LLQQVNNQLVHDFLPQQNAGLFLYFLSLWIYLWLAETSQQPISQTTWLRVIPHCYHYVALGGGYKQIVLYFFLCEISTFKENRCVL